jgi:hypothetical protein
MARPLRLEFPGAVHHVTSCGNARGPIYRDDEDRKAFLRVLAETTAAPRSAPPTLPAATRCARSPATSASTRAP